jgi:Uma2 family endonuclease
MLQWADVINDKTLENLPYKIELDAWGRIVMTPATNRHGILQLETGALLRQMLRGGRTITECSIETQDGVKVADVAWASRTFFKVHGDETPFTQSPEICVEVTSSSYSRQEIKEKIAAYLANGAREVWICDDKGALVFNDHSGKLKKSKLVPRFPAKIRVGTKS